MLVVFVVFPGVVRAGRRSAAMSLLPNMYLPFPRHASAKPSMLARERGRKRESRYVEGTDSSPGCFPSSGNEMGTQSASTALPPLYTNSQLIITTNHVQSQGSQWPGLLSQDPGLFKPRVRAHVATRKAPGMAGPKARRQRAETLPYPSKQPSKQVPYLVRNWILSFSSSVASGNPLGRVN